MLFNFIIKNKINEMCNIFDIKQKNCLDLSNKSKTDTIYNKNSRQNKNK